MTQYKDLGDEQEDERIRQIGEAAMTGKSTAFVTDSDPGKADRYIAKLTARFPKLIVLQRCDGPVKNAVTVKVGLRSDMN